MTGNYKFVIEYVGSKCKMGTKEMIQSIVEQSVRLRKGSLIFRGFDLGSLLLVYQILEVVKNYLLQYKFTEQDLAFLDGNNITDFIVDGISVIRPYKVTYSYMFRILIILLNSSTMIHVHFNIILRFTFVICT